MGTERKLIRPERTNDKRLVVLQVPVMTPLEAARIRDIVNRTTLMNGWTRSRHRSYSTEDIPLSDVPEVRFAPSSVSLSSSSHVGGAKELKLK
jgi:hypothetical protein